MLLTCFTNAFDRARFIYLTYLAMVSVLLTFTARNFITNSFTYSSKGISLGDRKSDAYNAAAAGGILLCITNYALIIFVGLGAASATNNNAGSGYAAPPLAGMGVGLGMGVGSSAPVEKYQVRC